MRSVIERMALLEAADALSKSREYPELFALVDAEIENNSNADAALQFHRFHSLVQLGRVEEAEATRAKVLPMFEVHKGSRLHRRFLNVSGILFTYAGQLQSAKDAFSEVLTSAARDGDELMLADAGMNLGVISDMLGRWDEALASHWRSLAAFTAVGDRAMVAGCHHNIGMTFRQLNLLDDADSHFETAIALYQTHGGKADVFPPVLERALILTTTGDSAVAEVLARKAYGEIRAIGHARLVGEAQRVLGIIMTSQGRLRRARRYLRSAQSTAALTRNPMLDAEIAEAMARVEEIAGDRQSELILRKKAAEAYRNIGCFGRARLVESE